MKNKILNMNISKYVEICIIYFYRVCIKIFNTLKEYFFFPKPYLEINENLWHKTFLKFVIIFFKNMQET